METAEEIYRSVLDALTGHLEAGDASGVLNYIALPFRMELLDRTHVCATPQDLEDLVLNYKYKMTESGVTSLHRTMEDARFIDDGVVEGFHVTAPLRYERPVIEPYAIRSLVVWDGDGWRSNHQEIVINDGDWEILPTRTRTALNEARRPWLDALSRQTIVSRSGNREALQIYQGFLDDLTPLLLEGDVERAIARHALPHWSKTLHETMVCTTEDDLRRALQTYCGFLRAEQVTRLSRVADAAYAISDTTIEGYHVTRAFRADGSEAIAPFASRNRLTLIDTVWKTVEQEGIIDNSEWRVLPSVAPHRRLHS